MLIKRDRDINCGFKMEPNDEERGDELQADQGTGRKKRLRDSELDSYHLS